MSAFLHLLMFSVFGEVSSYPSHIPLRSVTLFQIYIKKKLVQAAGRVEERVGNETGARHYYATSLTLQPGAPTLVAYAMLEMCSSSNRHPKSYNYTKVTKLFEEALLLDPRHGPVYNAYGAMELKRGNTDKARRIFQSGVLAHCTDAASVYHGLAKLELSLVWKERKNPWFFIQNES